MRVLAVVRDVKPDLRLAAHHVNRRAMKKLLIRRVVDILVIHATTVDLNELIRPWQAPSVTREDVVCAVAHPLSPFAPLFARSPRCEVLFNRLKLSAQYIGRRVPQYMGRLTKPHIRGTSEDG